ncbi:4-(cytidine 5'-diphospho)-2-C-methyl-D-erythritol kinase [Aquihabitans sp. McL0605]|uniref:4-(cytidine 5'-diphospho)-2-C-methyl-D-erythritol kinase n=1 Tax=Aquihabitans sp. McL0605 TaxID=3415671 RepID=UPI003CF2B86D
MPVDAVLAPAKLTVSLRITGVRPDGYHLIDAEMVSIDLADELRFAVGDGLEVIGATGLDVPADDDNLVRRALRLVGRTAHVTLTKRIPAGAGLGGGSTDAAAVLRWAGFDDPHAAAALGADVPFCVRGGRARVTGIGELLEPLDHIDRTFTLATPPFGCSTPEVYRAWDHLGGPTGGGPNDLEAAALRVQPELARWRDQLGDATGATPVLAGSGSTWFVEGAFPGAGTVVRTLAAAP